MCGSLKRLALLAPLLLGACATVPTGPGVLALPGSRKSFDEFRADDGACRQYAHEQVAGVTPSQAATDSGVRSAVVGTVLGAAAGAAIDGSRGAAAGAGIGLLAGGLVGAGVGSESAHAVQRRYDHGYLQCMYAKGHKVPVSRAYLRPREQAYSPPPPDYPPPPPPR